MITAAVLLIIALVAAIIIIATMPKPKQPAATKGNAPTVKDGTSARHYFGTCRIKDPMLLAWKVTGKDPIQTSGGKK